MAGFGTDLRQIQAIEKAVNAPVGCIHFHAKVEKRAERLARHASPGAKGQERVRHVLNAFREQLNKVLHFKALNMYLKIQSTRRETEELVEVAFHETRAARGARMGQRCIRYCTREGDGYARRGSGSQTALTAPVEGPPQLTGYSVSEKQSKPCPRPDAHEGSGEGRSNKSIFDGAQSSATPKEWSCYTTVQPTMVVLVH